MTVLSTRPSSYSTAGVDIDAANSAVERMKEHIATTRISGVLSSAAGNFGGMFALGASIAGMKEPVLVSSIDGVGTKLKLAFRTGRHASVAGDLVNHCINDILVQGAKPLFFLDYFATGKLDPSVAVEVVAGLSASCREAGCVLIGGETAEMPGMYAAGEYDLAGCIVGIVDRKRIVNGELIKPGDVLIGIASGGLQTNGYSLARHVLIDTANVDLKSTIPTMDVTYEDALLARHRCFAPAVLPILAEYPQLIKGMAHITGGGLIENIPRSLPNELGAQINLNAWDTPRIFTSIQEIGSINKLEMFRVFNMGIGYVIVASPNDSDTIISTLGKSGEIATLIGTITASSGVTLIG